MHKVGIDAMAFDSSRYYLDLKTLADARGIDPDKFYKGLGQRKMAVCPPGEDVVTMAANAGQHALQFVDDLSDVECLLFATESGVDQSKAAGIFVHKLLGLSSRCRVVELKQACYGATAGLRMALPMLQVRPSAKILLIASDVARYGLNTTGESSQGAGAVAMVLSANPRLMSIDAESGFHVEDVMDFWRPNYRETALVEGKFSCEMYYKLLRATWQQYQAISGRRFADHQRICYHVPLPRLAEKGHMQLANWSGAGLRLSEIEAQLSPSLAYARQTGNCYAASLYLSLISLLENDSDDFSGKRVGLYSYGSGAMAEFFSGVVEPEYRSVLATSAHKALLESRQELSHTEYEQFFNFSYPQDGSRFITPNHETGQFRLSRVEQHKRVYEKLNSRVEVIEPARQEEAIAV